MVVVNASIAHRKDQTARCENCACIMPNWNAQRGICPDCQRMLKEREHREKFSFRKNQNASRYYWLKAAPGNEDLIGIPMSIEEFHVGFYDWLVDAIFEKDGRLFEFDGHRLRAIA
jgi:hypothetical protein